MRRRLSISTFASGSVSKISPSGSSSELAVGALDVAVLPRAPRLDVQRFAPDPPEAERARRVSSDLKARAAAGRVELFYLDECGFSRTLSTGGSRTLPGERELVRHEAPQGHRVKALDAYRPYGQALRLEVFTNERTWTSYDLIGYLGVQPRDKCPRVVVLDDAGLHTIGVIRRARRDLARLDSLPPYSPELNEVEPVFRHVKYHEIPERSHTTRLGLRDAVEKGFIGYIRRLRSKNSERLRPAD